jgi:hypothetical protein
VLEAIAPLRAEFVDVDTAGQPDPAALDAALAHDPRGSVLLIAPGLGQRWHGGIATAAAARGVAIIDDRSHTPSGLAVARGVLSVRKWLPAPEGALGWGYRRASLDPPDAGWSAARRAALGAKGDWLATDVSLRGPKASILHALAETEAGLSRGDAIRAIDASALAAVGACDGAREAALRLQNAAVLSELLPRLSGWGHACSAIGRWSLAEPPLGLPLRVRDRDRVRRALAEERIYLPVHWPRPDALGGGFPGARALVDSALTLVVDGRYGERDMERLAAALGRVV